MPKAYWVTSYRRIKDPDKLAAYAKLAGPAIAPFGGRYLARGTAAAAYLHLARTITRRAERLMVELAAAETLNAAALQYINRLSDHLFVLARHLNDGGSADVLWTPGENR